MYIHRPRRQKRQKKVKYYPIIPRVTRKRVRRDDTFLHLNQPYVYAQVQYALRTYIPTGVKNVTYDNFRWTTVGWNESRTFQRNKDWKQIVAKKQNATYPYSRTGGEAAPVIYRGTCYSATARTECFGAQIGSVLVEAADQAWLKDVALARLKNRLNGDIGQANLLAPLAESREIHGLVRQINSLAMDTLKQLLLIKRTHGKSVLKHAGQVWLGFGFGVSPLIGDLSKAAESIHKYFGRSDHTTRVHGTASTDWHSSSTNGNYDAGEGVQYFITNKAEHQLSYRYSGGVNLKLRSDGNYGIFDHLGLEVSQLPATLWELTPFSWVVDYAATVGPWLDDMFYSLPGSLTYLSLNTRYQNRVVFEGQPTKSTAKNWQGTFRNGYSNYFSFSRVSLTTLPHRQLRVKTVDEIGKYGLTKLLNLGSVLAGGLKTPRINLR